MQCNALAGTCPLLQLHGWQCVISGAWAVAHMACLCRCMPQLPWGGLGIVQTKGYEEDAVTGAAFKATFSDPLRWSMAVPLEGIIHRKARPVPCTRLALACPRAQQHVFQKQQKTPGKYCVKYCVGWGKQGLWPFKAVKRSIPLCP